VRAEGARLLGELRDAGAVPALTGMLRRDRWYSKITAVYALGDIGDPRCVPALRAVAADPRVFDFPYMYNHSMIRIAAAAVLLRFGDGRGVRAISDLLRQANLQSYLELAPMILSLPESRRAKPLKDKVGFGLLEHSSRQFQSALHVRVLKALPFFRTPQSMRMIRGYLGHFSQYVRAAAAEALLACDPSGKSDALIARQWRRERAPFARIRLAQLLRRPELMACTAGYLADEDFFVRATAADALAAAGGPEWAGSIMPLLADRHFYVRLCAVEALEALKCRTAAPRIEALLADDSPRVRMQAAKYFVGAARASDWGAP
jgi:HEAT repeat protein